MKTDLPVASSDDPSWMKDPPLENVILNLQSASASTTGMGASGLESDVLAERRRRRRRRLSYDTDDEESIEDCCCCPVDPCLAALLLFHCIAGLLGVCAMATNAYHLAKPAQQQQQEAAPNVYIDCVMRGYSIVMSALIVCAESDWKFVMRRLKLLDLWIFRGLFYAYVGLTTLDLYSSSVETPECIVGLALIFIGTLYIIFGALCLKSVAARRRNNYREIPEENVVYESV